MRTFEDYKFRCHSVGKLMTGIKIGLTEKQELTFQDMLLRFQGEGKPLTEKQEQTFHELGARRNAKPVLSATAKSYLDDIHHHEFFGRSNHIQAKYLDKGLQVEHLAATLYSYVSGIPIFKNKEYRENDFIKGTADNAFKKIRDLKSSWNLTTFPLYDEDVKNSIYLDQLNGYMDLWDLDSAELIYCLVDTPFQLVEDELRRLSWKTDLLTYGGDIREENIPLVVELVQNHIFTKVGLKEFCHQSSNLQLEWFEDFQEIPPEMRVKVFTVEKDQKRIETLYEQIENARDYLNSLSLSMSQKFNAIAV